jgi:GxxExxY protein
MRRRGDVEYFTAETRSSFTAETYSILPQRRGGVAVFEKNFNMEYNPINAITGQVLDASVAVHKIMGPGLLESVYELCLMKELQLRGLNVQRQVPIPLIYKGYELSKEYVIDLLVENDIILEIKAVETLLPIHEAQLISYLKLADKKVGLLINFNVPILKNGFKRFVNNI